MRKVDLEKFEKAVIEIAESEAVGNFVRTCLENALRLRLRLGSELTSHAMRRHQKSGRRMSFYPPYSTKKDPADPKRLIIDKYERQVIERILELKKQGLGQRVTCRILTAEGYIPRKLRKKVNGEVVYFETQWNHRLISRVLEREGGAEKKPGQILDNG